MKKALLLILLLAHFSANAQSPDWLWAEGAWASHCEVKNIAIDPSGYAYATGVFSGGWMNFPSMTGALPCLGNFDVFLIKYDPQGNVVWQKSAGGTDWDRVYGICCDTDGNIYICGNFESPTLDFGAITLNNSDPSSSSMDAFIAKYDSLGNVIWAKAWGNSSTYESFQDIVSDKQNPIGFVADGPDNIFVTGYFSSSLIGFGLDTLSSNGDGDGVLAKYDSDGNQLLATSFGGIEHELSVAIAIDDSSNIFVTGSYISDVIYIQGDSLVSPTPSWLNEQVFVIKFDALANIIWAKPGDGNTGINPKDIATDFEGNVIVAGYFGGRLSFDTDTVISISQQDIYVAKLNINGNLQWLKSKGGPEHQICRSVATDPDGNIYITGEFYDASFIFGNDTLLSITTSISEVDGYVAKYSPLGDEIWARGMLGNCPKNCNAVAVDRNDNAYCGGIIDNGTHFGAYTVGGSSDIYMARVGFLTFSSINTSDNNIGINIFPNPALSLLTIKVSSDLSKPIDIKILNVIGQTVYLASGIYLNNQYEISIDIEKLPSGVYFITGQSNDNSFSEKFVKH
jgi:hypothetical protein